MDWHQVSRGPVSILADARTTQRRRCAIKVWNNSIGEAEVCLKTLSLRSFQTHHQTSGKHVEVVCSCDSANSFPARFCCCGTLVMACGLNWHWSIICPVWLKVMGCKPANR
jgi:hypothetical protein